jgi:hypothetical protein
MKTLKREIIKISVIMALFFFGQSISTQRLPAGWKGKVETEKDVRIINNQEDPLYGKLGLKIKKDLIIGNEEDDNYIFNNIIFPGVDSGGNIYVVDTANHRIQVFDENGVYLKTIGRIGQGPGELYYPQGIQFDKNDNMYIVGSLRLDVFNKNGEFIKKIHLPKFLKYFVVTPEKYIIGNFMMMEDFDGKQQLVDSVAVINPEGQLLRTLAKFPYRKPVLSQAFSGDALIAGDSFSPNLVYCPLTDGFSVYGYPSIY